MDVLRKAIAGSQKCTGSKFLRIQLRWNFAINLGKLVLDFRNLLAKMLFKPENVRIIVGTNLKSSSDWRLPFRVSSS